MYTISKVGSVVSLQNALPSREFRDRVSSLGNHTEIPQKGRNKGYPISE